LGVVSSLSLIQVKVFMFPSLSSMHSTVHYLHGTSISPSSASQTHYYTLFWFILFSDMMMHV